MRSLLETSVVGSDSPDKPSTMAFSAAKASTISGVAASVVAAAAGADAVGDEGGSSMASAT